MRKTLLCVLVGALLIAPATMAGTSQDPEIEDGTGDAELAGSQNQALDIERVWIAEDEALSASIEVVQLNGSDQTSAQAASGEWSAVFNVSEAEWQLRAKYVAGNLTADVLKNDQVVTDAETEVRTRNRTIEVRWLDYDTHLEAGSVLADTYAYSDVEDPGKFESAECHGREVVDCAPDQGYGDDFELGGEPYTTTVDGVEISVDRRVKQADPGQQTVYELAFDNPTDQDVVIDLDHTAPDPWDGTFSNETVTVRADSNAYSALELSIPADEPPGEVPFSVQASTDDDDAHLDLVAVVHGDSGDSDIEVSAEPANRSVGAGDEASYELTVANRGNESRTVELSVSGANPDWVTLSDDSLRLDPGEEETVTVTVAVPDDADAGIYSHRVTAESGAEGLEGPSSDTATLTTAVDAGVGSGLPTPGPGIAALAAGTLVAAVAWRRHRR